MLLGLPASDHDLLQSVPTPFRRKHVLLLPSLKPSKGSSGTVNRTHTCLAMIHEICHNLFFLTLFSSPAYVCLFGYSTHVRLEDSLGCYSLGTVHLILRDSL